MEESVYGHGIDGKEFFNKKFLLDVYDLNKAIARHEEEIEGNIFYSRRNLKGSINPESVFSLQTRRRNISRIAPYINSVIEVGVNGGHSALFWMSLNKNLKYYGVDICDHAYTPEAANYLSDKFRDRFKFFQGDSRDVLPTIPNQIDASVDLIIIDGGHSAEVAYQDIKNSLNVGKKLSSRFLLIDDADEEPIHKIILKTILSGKASTETLGNTLETQKQILLRI